MRYGVQGLPWQSKTSILIYVCITSFIVFKLAYNNDGGTASYNSSHRQLKHSNRATSRVEVNERDKHDREYMYIIIHYHKTGHDLTRSLIDMISSGIPGLSKPVVWNRRTMLSTFSSETKVSIALFMMCSVYDKLHFTSPITFHSVRRVSNSEKASLS